MPQVTFDARLAFLILVFAAVFAFGQAVIGLIMVARVKRKVNKRLILSERVGGISELVLELRKQRGLNENGKGRGGEHGERPAQRGGHEE